MAQAIFNHLKKLFPTVDREFEAISWGTGVRGDGKVNPKIIEPMSRIAVDVMDSDVYFPKTMEHLFVAERYKDVVKVFTMGCMANTCELSDGRIIDGDWNLDDPGVEGTDVIAVRDAIIGKNLELLMKL